MQNKTETAGAALQTILAEKIKEKRHLLRPAGSGVMGFVMASSVLFGGMVPFGVAFAAAMEGKAASFAIIGALFGYLTGGSIIASIKYMVCLGLILSAKWLSGGRLSKRWDGRSSVLICLLCVGISLGTATFLIDPTIYDIILMLADI